jgi:DNA-binding LacI/PurR family transcriptional regulator/signal transduction histidine kinase/DNA-binding NarL/FixJ family response regulator
MTRLVIVDDNPLALAGLRALFETTADFTVVAEAADGAEALVAAREANADVVLMDLSMPRMDGIEACRRLTAERPATRVIIYSALGGEQRFAAAMAAGAVTYLGKDLPAEELLSRVRSAAMSGAATPAHPPDQLGPTAGTALPPGAAPRPEDAAPEFPAETRGPAIRRARRRSLAPIGVGRDTRGGGTVEPPQSRAGAPREGGPTSGAPPAIGPAEPRWTVGILTPLLSGPYMSELMAGVSAGADEAGMRLIAIQTVDPGGTWLIEHPLPEVASRLPTQTLRIGWGQVDGFLVVLNAVDLRFLDAVAEAGKPVVVVSDDIEGFQGPTVRVNNRTGVMEAVAHLIEHGHRRIAFAGYLAQGDILERLEAYRDALTAHGIEPDSGLVFDASDSLESGGETAGAAMLAAGLPSTAVVAATDFNAMGIMKVLADAGLSVPRDQAVVGFDDVADASSIRPTLSTVHQSPRQIGRAALDLLIRALGGEPVDSGRHLLPTMFLARESCGCSPASALERLGVDGTLSTMTPEERFRHRLDLLLTGPDPLSAAQRRALDGVATLTLRLARTAQDDQQPATADLRRASVELLAVAPRWTTITSVEACLERYRDESGIVVGADSGGSAVRFERFVREMVVELSRTLSQIEGHARTSLQVGLGAEHDVSMSIIRGGIDDPSSLDWLTFTTARAGCLGLWTDDTLAAGGHPLRIGGSFLRGGRLLLPEQSAIEAFPPVALVMQRRPGEIVAVVPVKTTSMDLGLLAVVIPVGGPDFSGRDHLFDKGALLGISLQREVTTERLRRSNENLATFSHAMAHDLRNPLATILMWASSAHSRAGPDDRAEPVLRAVDRIREVAGYANDLIGSLLRYAELDRNPAPAAPVDLDVVISKAVATLESVVYESRAVIETRDLPTVIADAAGVELVIENLISNAIKYHHGGSPRVTIDASGTAEYWKVRCHDNGSGIPPALLEDIFQPFVRGEPSISGSGLGLATCRRIIARLGGRIWVEDTSSAGTTIAFTLPRRAGDALQIAGPSPFPGTDARAETRGSDWRLPPPAIAS